MRQKSAIGALFAFALDSSSSAPAYRQLYKELRAAILSGRLEAGSRLPASRVLATELDLSRNTVVAALDLLQSEGYVESRVGDGTYVAVTLPEDRFLPREPVKRGVPTTVAYPALSERGRALTHLSVTGGSMKPGPFAADLPAFDKFPIDAWSKLMAQSWRQVQPSMLGYADPAGYEPLRHLIAQHLRAARLLKCSASEVIITSGTQQSLDLLARVLIDQGDPVWLEEPGYVGARSAFIAAGARIVPVPVSESGLEIDAGVAREPKPRLIFVSPSRQYPLGVTMSRARRLELLAFADRSGAWIIEDDYDSEFRYRGAPLPAMQSMDEGERVIFLGTFSKSLLPSFRLGYIVVPPRLATAFANAKGVIDRHPPLLEQITLSSFIQNGLFAAHVRRMRQLYEARQVVLMEEIRLKVGTWLDISPADTGMHVVGYLADGIDDRDVCLAALERGLALRPLSIYYMEPPRRNGLILGFASTPPDRIRWGASRLAALFEEEGWRKSSTPRLRLDGTGAEASAVSFG